MYLHILNKCNLYVFHNKLYKKWFNLHGNMVFIIPVLQYITYQSFIKSNEKYMNIQNMNIAKLAKMIY